MYRAMGRGSVELEQTRMEAIGGWAGRIRNRALLVSMALGFALASPVLIVYPAQGVIWATYVGLGLVAGYTLHRVVALPLARIYVERRAAEWADAERLDRAQLTAMARTFVA